MHNEEPKMENSFEDVQKFNKTHVDSAAVATQSFVEGLQAIAAETTDYSKKSLEAGSAFVAKLLGLKTTQEAVQLQLEFAKSSYTDFVAEATKIRELYCNLAKDAFKPALTR
jgi:hypothetical protein